MIFLAPNQNCECTEDNTHSPKTRQIITSVSAWKTLNSFCLISDPTHRTLPSPRKSLSLYVGSSFAFSFSLAWRSTTDPCIANNTRRSFVKDKKKQSCREEKYTAQTQTLLVQLCRVNWRWPSVWTHYSSACCPTSLQRHLWPSSSS